MNLSPNLSELYKYKIVKVQYVISGNYTNIYYLDKCRHEHIFVVAGGLDKELYNTEHSFLMLLWKCNEFKGV